MYSLPKYNNNNNNQSYYYSLAQQYESKRHSHSVSTNSNCNSSSSLNNEPYQFTFNSNFGSNQYLNSAHVQKKYTSKYRSSSLPSQILVRNLRSNHFSYYDQLKGRDYIKTNNCYFVSKNKNQPRFNKKEFLQSSNIPKNLSMMNDLNRFSKYDLQKRINKNGLNVRTNVKVYDKYDRKNRFTQVNTNFQPHEQRLNARQKIIDQRPNEEPIIDCYIDVKSDDQGRFYSAVQSQSPTLLINYNNVYCQNQQMLTTHATLVRDYSYSFDNLSKIVPKSDFKQFINSPAYSMKQNSSQFKKMGQKNNQKYIYSKYFIDEMQSRNAQKHSWKLKKVENQNFKKVLKLF